GLLHAGVGGGRRANFENALENARRFHLGERAESAEASRWRDFAGGRPSAHCRARVQSPGPYPGIRCRRVSSNARAPQFYPSLEKGLLKDVRVPKPVLGLCGGHCPSAAVSWRELSSRNVIQRSAAKGVRPCRISRRRRRIYKSTSAKRTPALLATRLRYAGTT